MTNLVPSSGAQALPVIVTAAGERAQLRFLEFFAASIRNPHTRRAYAHAVAEFLAWCEGRCQRRSKNPQNRRSKNPQFRRSAHRVGVSIFRRTPARPRRLIYRGRRNQRFGPDVLGHEFGVLTQTIA